MWRGTPHITRAEWRGRCRDRLMAQEMAVSSALSEPILEVRTGDRGPELVIRYAHTSDPSEIVYRR